MTRMVSSVAYTDDRRGGGSPSTAGDRNLALMIAKRHVAIRRNRRRRFPDIAFDDPNWEMLLDLFIASEEGRRVSVTSLTIAAQVSTSTALRCIKRLVKDGHMHRRADPSDARRTFLFLSPAVHTAIREEMLSALRSYRPLIDQLGDDAAR